MYTQTTTVFFTGGPRDGDEAQFADPPSTVAVEGETFCVYNLIDLNHYHWMIGTAPSKRIPPAPPSPVPLVVSPAVPPKKSKSIWWRILKYIILIKLIAVVIFVLLSFLMRMETQFERQAGVAKDPIPVSTPAPTPAASDVDDRLKALEEKNARFLHEPITIVEPNPTPAASQEEIRRQARASVDRYFDHLEKPALRAEPVTTGLRRESPLDQGWTTMPYGERVYVKVWGRAPNQESLPRMENDIGDAYLVGKDLFVWVAPNGSPAQWIDPVVSLNFCQQ